jgi:hypothetical protein
MQIIGALGFFNEFQKSDHSAKLLPAIGLGASTNIAMGEFL